MLRTSLSLPKPVYDQLQILAQQRQTSVSEVIRSLLEKILIAEQQLKQKKVFSQLKKLQGIGKPGIRDASSTIDLVLYQESKGSNDAK